MKKDMKKDNTDKFFDIYSIGENFANLLGIKGKEDIYKSLKK